MSTKIYNAFIYKGSTEELLSYLYQIKKEYIELMKSRLSKINVDTTFEKKRYNFLSEDITLKLLKEKSDEPYSPKKKYTNIDFPEFVLTDIIETEMKRSEYHPFNINASAVVYFCENKIYIQFFGLPRDFQKIKIESFDKFKDYHYQNSTDMSNYDWDKEDWNQMSKERKEELQNEWCERHRVWEKIMSETVTPSECGLVYDFHPNHYDLSMFCRELLKMIK